MNKQLVCIVFLVSQLQAMEQNHQTVLHLHAAAKEYDACVRELVTIDGLQGEVLEKARFPMAALATLSRDPAASAPEKNKAQLLLGACAQNLEKLLSEQFMVAQEKRKALDWQQKTAQDRAREAGAPGALLELLNPGDTVIVQSCILAYLHTAIQVPEEVAIGLEPDRDPKEGDIMIMNGNRYVCNEVRRPTKEK